MSKLTIAQSLRMLAALSPNGFTVTLDREAALAIVRALERGDAIMDIEARLAAMRFDMEIHHDRAERTFANIAWNLCACASVLIFAAWLIA